jgi:hypothetical protein
MANQTIPISQIDLNYIQSVHDSGTDLYLAYERVLPYLEPGSDRYFWFEQAAIINRKATGIEPPSDNNLGSTYILAHSAYGLELDGHSNDLAVTSNAIALNVLQDILSDGGISDLGSMLNNDIAVALDLGNQTIGGWGGSFYYWDLPYEDSTVGQNILSSAAELEKFLLSSATALLAVAVQELGEGPTQSEILTVANTAISADVPVELKAEIVEIAARAMTSGQIIGSADYYGQWEYDPVGDIFKYTNASGELVIAIGSEEEFLRERLTYRLEAETKGLNYVTETLGKLGLFHLIPEDQKCFAAGTPISMADGTSKAIEAIEPGDLVQSFDRNGRLVPGRVTRTFVNESKILLDFHGTLVTPGHVYYCADGQFEGQFAPLIDILRDDGAVQHEDGTTVRAATGCEIGSTADTQFWAFLVDEETGKITDKCRVRLGTRWMAPDGTHFSMQEYFQASDFELLENGYVHLRRQGITSLFVWTFSEALPKPEDFVLQRSQTTLEDIFTASEWESQHPRIAAPVLLDGGPVRPSSHAELKMMPRNEPMMYQTSAQPSKLLQERNSKSVSVPKTDWTLH